MMPLKIKLVGGVEIKNEEIADQFIIPIQEKLKLQGGG